MGAKLFEPRNYHEDKFVMNLTKQNDIEAYWIGINRRLDGKSVYSSDNTSLSWSHFEALAKPEKQHTPLCTVISFNNGMGGWKDKDCSLKRHSVCDKHIGKPFFIFPSSASAEDNLYLFSRIYVSIVFPVILRTIQADPYSVG